MLWIEPCTIICVALLGGFFGGGLMAFVNRQNNRFNMYCMQEHFKHDVLRLESMIEAQEKKLSTILVNNSVGNQRKYNNNKGYRRSRHFNQRG